MISSEVTSYLTSKKSTERRNAAKLIGKQHLKEFGAQLFDAYLKEKKNPKTWETKTEMILALGLVDFNAALSEMELIVNANLPYDMITLAAAQTYTRLSRKSLTDAKPSLTLLEFGRISVIKGALAPLGSDKMMPLENEIKELVNLCWDLHQHKDCIGKENGILDPRYSLALACAGWDKSLTGNFLNHCLLTFGKDNTLKEVAELALKGKYGKSR